MHLKLVLLIFNLTPYALHLVPYAYYILPFTLHLIFYPCVNRRQFLMPTNLGPFSL